MKTRFAAFLMTLAVFAPAFATEDKQPQQQPAQAQIVREEQPREELEKREKERPKKERRRPRIELRVDDLQMVEVKNR